MNGKRVSLEPELERIAGGLKAAERRRLARKLFRWSKQLFVSAGILERDAGPRPHPRLKRLSPAKLARN